MELNVLTFTWLRDLGCLKSIHAAPTPTKGMVVLTHEALRLLQHGASICRLLRHYCCDRFDTPQALLPQDGDQLTAKRHNWGVVSRMLKDALGYDLSWERRELIVQGDVVEILVLLKQIHDLVKVHRQVDKEQREKHRLLCEDPHRLYVMSLIARPAAGGGRGRSVSSPVRGGGEAYPTSLTPPPLSGGGGGHAAPMPSPNPADASHPKPWLTNLRKGPPRRLPPIEEERLAIEAARRKRSKPLHLDHDAHHMELFRPSYGGSPTGAVTSSSTPPPVAPPPASSSRSKSHSPTRQPPPAGAAEGSSGSQPPQPQPSSCSDERSTAAPPPAATSPSSSSPETDAASNGGADGKDAMPPGTANRPATITADDL